MVDEQRENDTILHQEPVEGVVDERLDGIDSENTGIAPLVAITGGQSPTEAEHNLVIDAINDIIDALVSSHIVPEVS
jgi:hypothetical protein